MKKEIIGDCTLYLGDCLEIMPQIIKDKSADMVITDPPYMIDYKEWDNCLFQKCIDFEDFTEKWIKECFRILKDTGSFWSFMGYQNIVSFFKILEKYGFPHYENWVIWARQKGRGSSKHLKSQREDIIHVTKNKIEYVWNNLKMLREVVCPYTKNGKPRGWFLDENGKRVRWTGLGNVWVYSVPYWGGIEEKQVHPSQKPIMLIERLALLSSNENAIIFDPFMGSGTTGVVCIKSKRKFIGIEGEEKYFDIACERIAKANLEPWKYTKNKYTLFK